MRKNRLLINVLLAIVGGIVCSLFFPDWATRVFITFNSIFSNFLGFFIPVLIIALIAPAIADLGNGAGKLLGLTLLIAYISTILSGTASYLTCKLAYPHLLQNSLGSLSSIDSGIALKPYFTVEIPAFINVTSALVLAFILGLGCSAIKGKDLKNVLDDLRQIIFLCITKVFIPCLPLFIFGIFLKIGCEGQVAAVLGMFVKIIAVILALHVCVLFSQFLIAGAISGKNPIKALAKMLPAYATALGTMSSAATIPVTLSCAKKLDVNSDIADFAIPLCATIHMPCSILKIVACTFAISFCSGMPVNFGLYFGFILMLSITMIAAPGVPGGAVMAAIGVMATMLGFDADMQGFVVAIYIAIDGFGTAGNVTGDGAITMIMDRIYKKRAAPAE